MGFDKFNYIILIILLYAIVAGTKKDDYKVKLKELPWWILAIGGFTLSLLGLFKFNDERIIFMGCGILGLAKFIGYLENKKNNQ